MVSEPDLEAGPRGLQVTCWNSAGPELLVPGRNLRGSFPVGEFNELTLSCFYNFLLLPWGLVNFTPPFNESKGSSWRLSKAELHMLPVSLQA